MARRCYFVPMDRCDQSGYSPVIVTEGETISRGVPFGIADTYEGARGKVANLNSEMGLSQRDIDEIMKSWVLANQRGWGDG